MFPPKFKFDEKKEEEHREIEIKQQPTHPRSCLLCLKNEKRLDLSACVTVICIW